MTITGNLAFHLLQDVRDNSISPIHHKTDEEVPILHTTFKNHPSSHGITLHDVISDVSCHVIQP